MIQQPRPTAPSGLDPEPLVDRAPPGPLLAAAPSTAIREVRQV